MIALNFLLLPLLVPIFLLDLAPPAFCQVSVARCNGAWANQNRCLRDNVVRVARSDAKFSLPDQLAQNRIKGDVVNCFKREGCTSNPIPSNQESNARRDCFRTAKRDADRELRKCVNGRVKGWKEPDDYPKVEVLGEWSHIVLRVKDALRNPRPYCGDNLKKLGAKQSLQRCVNAAYNFDKQQPARNINPPPSYWCDQDGKCWGDVQADCRNQWDEQIQPALCQCTRSSPRDSERIATESYARCVQSRRFLIQGAVNDDPGPAWVTDYVRSLCVNSNNHPCKRQRRDYEKRG